MEKRPIHTGDLVVTDDGYYALVLEHLEYGVSVLRSNGLETHELEGRLKILPLKVGGDDTGSPASFVEALRLRHKSEQDQKVTQPVRLITVPE